MLPRTSRGLNPISATLLVLAVFVAAGTVGFIVSRHLTSAREVPAGALPSPAVRFDLIVEQSRTDTYMPVQFAPRANEYQKVAQTFTVPDDGLLLQAVAPHVAFAQGEFWITIREHPTERKEPTGNVLRRLSIDAFDVESAPGFHTVGLQPPLRLKGGHLYSMTIEVRNRVSAVGASLIHAQDLYEGGRAWYFTRVIGPNGDLFTQHHVWQPTNEDLAFRLVFERYRR